MHSHDYYEVPILEVVVETETAVSLVLDVPEELRETFRYRPGQFLTLRVPVEGKFRHRCYSLSSAPDLDAKHKITVKRVDNGLVSNEICSSLRSGQKILVQPPAGHFVPASLDEDFLLFAGGSGITPVLSILKAALAEGSGKVVLLYANRDQRSVIFRDELIDLAAAHPERLTVLHWLETVQGLPTAAQLASLVRPWASCEAFICGPELFMAGVSTALATLGVDDERIHLERFVSLPDEDAAETMPVSAGEDVRLEVLIDGERHELQWARNAKMLDTMLAAGVDAPYSCRVGGCSACMCRVQKGAVRMAQNLVLDERELAEGWVLACQAFAESDEVSVEIPS
jgi:3-ketosteroid 9alpha-monooxygenase subunit B